MSNNALNLAALVAVAAAAFTALAEAPTWANLAVSLLGGLAVTLLFWKSWGPSMADFFSTKAGAEGLDPWAVQERLMRISGQQIPSSPMLTKGSLLYSALVMEEAGETFDAVRNALAAYIARNTDELRALNHLAALELVCSRLAQVADSNQAKASHMREFIATLPDDLLRWPLTDGLAAPILDGVVDLAVTNCGLAIAFGLPGREGYAEVAASNFSKANHETGLIEKTLDGKWIKGKGFFKPDLHRVLDERRQQKP